LALFFLSVIFRVDVVDHLVEKFLSPPNVFKRLVRRLQSRGNLTLLAAPLVGLPHIVAESNARYRLRDHVHDVRAGCVGVHFGFLSSGVA